MNPKIMLIVAILLLVGAVVRTIDWKKYAVRWVGANPAKAMLFIKSGEVIEPVIGERDKDNVLIYNYKIGKNKLSVTLSPQYPYEFLKSSGRRIIGVEDGKPIASPLGYMTAEQRQKCLESSIELSALTNSQAVVKALRSISDAKPFNWMILLIIGAVVIGGIYWYSNKDKPGEPAQSANTQTVQSANNTIPELILINDPVKVTP